MRQITLPALAVLLFACLFAGCYEPYPADLDTITLNVTIGRTTPAELIMALGEPSSREKVSGDDLYTFSFKRSVLRLFVDMPGSENDKIVMIDGADDVLRATFSGGVLTSAY
ncbi:MAG: hypothetical protein LBR53_02345 [Deltaproteobacteria bacterium]|jgi:hypothetical protein|nr:hypothetical protein [Deltaproteobacteria bacterium]